MPGVLNSVGSDSEQLAQVPLSDGDPGAEVDGVLTT